MARGVATWADPGALVGEGPLQVGDPAPDLELVDSEGSLRRLGEFWSGRPALVVFWRHFGCGCGNVRAQRLGREHAQYARAGAAVVVVGQAEPERTAAYAERFAIPCPLLCDPEFAAYDAYGSRDGDAAQVFYDGPEGLRRGDYEAGASFAAERRAAGRPVVDSPWLLPGRVRRGRDRDSPARIPLPVLRGLSPTSKCCSPRSARQPARGRPRRRSARLPAPGLIP